MAKGILAQAGVPIPPGRLCATPQEAAAAAAELGPVAVKAQVLVGGRGKAGGIRLAATPAEAEAAAAAIIGMDLKGYRVERVYCEAQVTADRELYLAVTVDPLAREPVLIASAQGGVDIEDVPEKAITRRSCPLPWGLQAYAARDVAGRLDLPGPAVSEFASLASKLFTVFRDTDAELVECNPLALVGERLVALDARLNLDDDAVGRHPELPKTQEATELESRVRALGLAFVELDGDIAVMANGAGITMATLDALEHFGGRPMNFLDAGGGASAGPTAAALDVLVSCHPKAILVNIFGGITRCDEVARALVEVARRHGGMPVSTVVRLVGTNEQEGTAILREEGIAAFTSMREAASKVVALAGEVPGKS